MTKHLLTFSFLLFTLSPSISLSNQEDSIIKYTIMGYSREEAAILVGTPRLLMLDKYFTRHRMSSLFPRAGLKKILNQPQNLAMIKDYRELLIVRGDEDTVSLIDEIFFEIREKKSIEIIRRLERYEEIIEKYGDEFSVSPNLIKAVIIKESDINQNAVSKKGAQGLMQLIPRTANDLGVSDSFDPEQNIYGGVKYLRILLDKFGGDISLSLAAFNAGPEAVSRYKGIPPFKETEDYVRSILKYKKMLDELGRRIGN